MPQRQDYVQRLLEELTHLLEEVMRFRLAGSHEAALLTLLHAQERLFVRPAQELMSLPVPQQLHLLAVDEPAAVARDKCLAYAALLTEVGRTYRARGQAGPADGAFQVALQVTLLTAQQHTSLDGVEIRRRLDALLNLLPRDRLGSDTEALLRQFEARA